MTLSRLQFLQRLGLGTGLLAAGRLSAADAVPPRVRGPIPFRAEAPEAFWRSVRTQYAVDSGLVYLNCGGLGPSPRTVLETYDWTARELQLHVDNGYRFFSESRAIVAGFLGAETDELCFVRNATEGNSIVASGLELHAGDEVVIETHAHPGGSLPWLNLARQSGVVVRAFAPDATSVAGNVERIAALLSPRTRVVQVSHVTAPTGIVMPVREIAELCRSRGVWLHVDGAQSAGMIPVDFQAMRCDSYATSGHKWLGATRETGVLLIRQEQVDRVVPWHLGAHASDDFDFSGRVAYVTGARRHEYGTRNAASVAALAEAARFSAEIGPERIAAHNAAIVAATMEGLRRLPRVRVLTPELPALRAAMLTFKIEGLNATQAYGTLLERNRLRCRPVTEDGLEAVRASFHIFNEPEDGERLVAAVRELVSA